MKLTKKEQAQKRIEFWFYIVGNLKEKLKGLLDEVTINVSIRVCKSKRKGVEITFQLNCSTTSNFGGKNEFSVLKFKKIQMLHFQ